MPPPPCEKAAEVSVWWETALQKAEPPAVHQAVLKIQRTGRRGPGDAVHVQHVPVGGRYISPLVGVPGGWVGGH